jgi:hypothetical protein
MSIEIFALSNRRVASFNRWQEQIDVASLHLVLPTQGSIDKLHGFLPVRLEGNASGFECAHCDPNEVAKLYPNIDFGRNWTRAIAFNSQGLEEASLRIRLLRHTRRRRRGSFSIRRKVW